MQRLPVLVFALQEKRWVGINEVTSGLKCNCNCPNCGEPLIAKKGVKNKHHFAHASGHSCTGALETALHQYAKYIIANTLRIITPPVKVYRGPTLRRAKWEQFNHAVIEYAKNGFRYDVLLQTKSYDLAVEIKVSHGTPVQKIKAAAYSKLNVLEIDVGNIYQQLIETTPTPSLKRLNSMILGSFQDRKWLVNLWQHRYEFRLFKQAVERKVVISTQNGYRHYHVYRCPLRKRFVRSGFREGQSFARLFQDCLYCPCCRKIKYQQEWVGFQQLPDLPISIFCNEECLSLSE
ncbi:MAG: competence protein CoiA family protein [Bacteroidota bacterium]